MISLKPLISVIIPIYNVEKYIERCLKSILKQSYENFEIIAVDDGSKDGSGKICDLMAETDSRIRVFHIENGGAGNARNFGMEQAVGDYIMFMDSDDYLMSGCFERMLGVANKHNLDMVQCSYITGKQNDFDKIPQRKNALILSTNQAFETRKINICVWGKLCKKEILKNCRYPAKSLFDDEFFTYKLIYAAKKIGYIDEAFYYYYQSDNSIMRVPKRNVPLGYIAAYEERIAFFKERDEQNLVGISHKELAIRLMLSFFKARKCIDFKENKELIIQKFRQEYKDGLKYAGNLKEKISLFLFYVFCLFV